MKFFSLGLHFFTYAAMGIENIFVHIFMVTTLTVSVHVLYKVMVDLDTPFSGVWNIDKDDLKSFVNSFQKKIN